MLIYKLGKLYLDVKVLNSFRNDLTILNWELEQTLHFRVYICMNLVSTFTVNLKKKSRSVRNGAGNVMKGLARRMHRLTHAAYLLIHTHLHVRQISNKLNYCLLTLFFIIFCSQKENQEIHWNFFFKWTHTSTKHVEQQPGDERLRATYRDREGMAKEEKTWSRERGNQASREQICGCQ